MLGAAFSFGGMGVAVALMVGGVYFEGKSVGRAEATAAKSRDEAIARVAYDAAIAGAADAIGRIEVRNVTITRALEREVFEREVFRDCRSGPHAVELLNSSPGVAPAEPESPTSGDVRPAGPVDR